MTHAASAGLFREVVAAWNARDVERYGSLLDDDCIIETQAVPGAVQGRDAARKRMQMYFNAVPDLFFELTDVVAFGDRVFARWVAYSTPEATRGETGNGLSAIGGCTVATVREGKFVHLWSYWDADDIVKAVNS